MSKALGYLLAVGIIVVAAIFGAALLAENVARANETEAAAIRAESGRLLASAQASAIITSANAPTYVFGGVMLFGLFVLSMFFYLQYDRQVRAHELETMRRERAGFLSALDLYRIRNGGECLEAELMLPEDVRVFW